MLQKGCLAKKLQLPGKEGVKLNKILTLGLILGLILVLSLGLLLAGCSSSEPKESGLAESPGLSTESPGLEATEQEQEQEITEQEQSAFWKSGIQAKIQRVVDGDTLVLDFYDSGIKDTVVRLIGINTPEVKSPFTSEQCFGPEASARLKYLTEQEAEVYLFRDVEPYDIYDRLLGYLYRASDGKMLNELMVEEGFARTLEISPNTSYSRRLKAAESRAMSQKLGLWEACQNK